MFAFLQNKMEPILAQLLFLSIADLQKIADFFQLEIKIFYLPQMVDFSDLFLLDLLQNFVLDNITLQIR